MNYSELTDLEINKLVNKKRTGKESIFVFDYCNNPSYSWPIILENGISINAPDYFNDPENGHGVDTFDTPMIRDKNPLRAAMIVYLMMNKEA